MTDEGVEIVRRLYDAWNGDDFEAARPLLHPKIEWRSSGIFLDLDRESQGIDAVEQWWHGVKEAWKSFSIEPRNIEVVGDLIVVETHFDAIGRGSGARIELDFTHVWQVESGKIVRYVSRPTRSEALEAAGET